jgi:hypothetical protein
VLLSIFALLIGAAIGRARGGHVAGLIATRLRGKALLTIGVGATLVLNVLTPAQPMFWLTVSILAFFGFAFANLAFTGMIVVVIGMLMNLAPVLANGAVPVSERALVSVDVVDDSGNAAIDGVRESSATATRLAVFGDIVPVPVVNRVVSLGDLVILVALADVVMNLLLRARTRSDDDAGVTFAAGEDDFEIDLRDDQSDHDAGLLSGRRKGPAHAASSSPLIAPLPRVRRPLHAANTSAPVESAPVESAPIESSPIESDLGPSDQPPPPTGTPLPGPPPLIDLTESAPTPPVLNLTDRRPIIDLTVSPSDTQLEEFLRRREDADRRLIGAELAAPAAGHRRNRTKRKHSRTMEDAS